MRFRVVCWLGGLTLVNATAAPSAVATAAPSPTPTPIDTSTPTPEDNTTAVTMAPTTSPDSSPQWIVGVGIAFFGALTGSLGDNLIRLSGNAGEKHRLTQQQRRFILPAGIFCEAVLNPILTIAALYFAAIEIIVPLAGVHIVMNLFWARTINKERVTMVELVSTVIITTGVTIVLVFAPKNPVLRDLDQLKAYLDRHELWWMGGATAVFILFLLLLGRTQPSRRVDRLRLSLLCGTTGGMSNSFTACASRVLGIAFQGQWSLFSDGYSWLFIGLAVATALVQLGSLTQAFRTYDAVVVSPYINASLILMGCLFGAIFFDTYNSADLNFDTTARILLPTGVLVIVLGCMLLDRHKDGGGGHSSSTGGSGGGGSGSGGEHSIPSRNRSKTNLNDPLLGMEGRC